MATNSFTNSDQVTNVFQKFSADDQLAILWFIYDEIRGSITPNSNDNETGFAIVQGLVDQMAAMPQEQQLQVQRDVITGAGSGIAQSYDELNSSDRLAFWYILAQEMEKGKIINVPQDYQLSSDAQGFFDGFKGTEFEGQITFMRNAVSLMGSKPKKGAIAS